MHKIILLLPFVVCNCMAFGFKVHSLIGQLVQDVINNTTRQNINSCEYTDSFSKASVWPDKVKYTKQFSWTRSLHYFDVDNDPPNNCGTLVYQSGKDKYDSNLYTYIDHILKLKNSGGGCFLKPFEFKLLLHLLQDLHQPLHLTGKKRGGNSQIIDIGDKSYNFHSFWDSVLYDLFIESHNLKTFQNQIDFFHDIIKKSGDVECPTEIDMELFVKWGNEISRLNCELLWNYNDVDYIHKSTELLVKLVQKSVTRSVCVLQVLYN
jgi:hypothetical protein